MAYTASSHSSMAHVPRFCLRSLPDLPMIQTLPNLSDRYERAASALIEAFTQNSLTPGSTTHDTIGTLTFAATGERDGSWWKSLLAYRFDRLRSDDVNKLSDLQDQTGYNAAELSLIEESFEGIFITGTRQVILTEDLSIFQRLTSVLECLADLENQEHILEIPQFVSVLDGN